MSANIRARGRDEPVRMFRNRGPIAGTGAATAISGIGAADLGEIVALPDGSHVAVFGDSFRGDCMGADPHYASVAVPVSVDADGRPRFGEPLTGPDGSAKRLFRPPRQARGTNTLPSGSIAVGATTYMMVVGTADLRPVGGSWLVEVTGKPGHRTKGWKAVEGSWRPMDYADGGQSQISGYRSSDGTVYIVADSFDRSQGVALYRAQSASVADRSTWQPCARRPDGGHRWGAPGQPGRPISGPGQRFGELSFREIDGKAVLSAFNSSEGRNQVEVRVADKPWRIFAESRMTVVAQQNDPRAQNYLSQNYGGYIVPGSTLDRMGILVSQWNTMTNATYNVSLLELEVVADLLDDRL